MDDDFNSMPPRQQRQYLHAAITGMQQQRNEVKPLETPDATDTSALRRDVARITSDNTITPDEVPATIAALGLVVKVLDQQEQIMSETKAEYEDKMRQKDALLVKICALVAGGFFGQSALQFWLFNVPIEKLAVAGLIFLCSFALSIGALYLQQRFPNILPKLKATTAILKPFVDPQVRQGIEAVEKIVQDVTGSTGEQP